MRDKLCSEWNKLCSEREKKYVHGTNYVGGGGGGGGGDYVTSRANYFLSRASYVLNEEKCV